MSIWMPRPKPVPGRTSGAHDEDAFFGLMREIVDQVVVARFSVPGEPVSKARFRFTKSGRKYTPTATIAAEDHIAAAYRRVTNAAPDSTGAFGVIGIFFAATRQRRDVDNMLKLILDGLNGVAWTDDNQVLEVSGRKTYIRELEDARTEVLVYHLGPMPKWTANCEHCGKEFPVYRSQKGRRFCSRECDSARRAAARTIPCPVCGKPFIPHSRQVTCSMECRRARKTVNLVCMHCGESFTRWPCHAAAPVLTCSVECRKAYWSARPPSNPKGTCQECGGPTSKANYTRCRPCSVQPTLLQPRIELTITEVAE